MGLGQTGEVRQEAGSGRLGRPGKGDGATWMGLGQTGGGVRPGSSEGGQGASARVLELSVAELSQGSGMQQAADSRVVQRPCEGSVQAGPRGWCGKYCSQILSLLHKVTGTPISL